MTATQDVQVFKQEAGACHDDGSVMEPGWYWVRQRAGADSTLPPIPYGTPVGPFATSRRAAHDYVLTTAAAQETARRRALDLAAEDMLAALRNVRSYLTQARSGYDMREIDAAIAKAEGAS
jgi:hypothetical protein